MPQGGGAYPSYGPTYTERQAAILDSAGLSGETGYATGTALGRGASQQGAHVRHKTLPTIEMEGEGGPYQPHPAYADQEARQQPQYYAPQQVPPRPVSTAEDPYEGYIDSRDETESIKEEDIEDDAPYVPYHHDDDYGYDSGRRVLKVNFSELFQLVSYMCSSFSLPGCQ